MICEQSNQSNRKQSLVCVSGLCRAPSFQTHRNICAGKLHTAVEPADTENTQHLATIHQITENCGYDTVV